jgi:hypothetical protein
MPRHDKSRYTNKQERDAEKHIEEAYEQKGVSDEKAERRAATVNRQAGGAKKAAETRKRRGR